MELRVSGQFRITPNEEFRDLYAYMSPIFFRTVTFMRLELAGYLTMKEEKLNIYSIYTEKLLIKAISKRGTR
jgi:hypothetical protein